MREHAEQPPRHPVCAGCWGVAGNGIAEEVCLASPGTAGKGRRGGVLSSSATEPEAITATIAIAAGGQSPVPAVIAPDGLGRRVAPVPSGRLGDMRLGEVHGRSPGTPPWVGRGAPASPVAGSTVRARPRLKITPNTMTNERRSARWPWSRRSRSPAKADPGTGRRSARMSAPVTALLPFTKSPYRGVTRIRVRRTEVASAARRLDDRADACRAAVVDGAGRGECGAQRGQLRNSSVDPSDPPVEQRPHGGTRPATVAGGGHYLRDVLKAQPERAGLPDEGEPGDVTGGEQPGSPPGCAPAVVASRGARTAVPPRA